MKVRFFVVTIFFASLAMSLRAGELPSITRYRLDIRFLLQDQRITTRAGLTIRNHTGAPHESLPFLLYRLLEVQRVSDTEGRPVDFTQKVIQLSDQPSLQAREVIVHLPSILKPGDSVNLDIEYSGYIFGYPEVMAYVNDRIDETYSLLRPDAISYPIIADGSFAGLLAAYNNKFTFDLSATVPRGYLAACGGHLVNRRESADSTTFEYSSRLATWRIDLAVAKFAVLSDPGNRILIYYLTGDSAGARRVLAASSDVVRLYTTMFGRPQRYEGYTIIEIPDGWGSQAGDFYFLQTAAAFEDSSNIGEVYHEIGHSWNVTPSEDIRRCRYFDEAFASFFEPLAIRAFQGNSAFNKRMAKDREMFVRSAKVDTEAYTTPIAGYGKKELGRYSYTKGAWSLYVLFTIIGEKTFDSLLQSLMTEFQDRTITFEQYQSLCERISKRNLSKYFNEWIYGAESSELLFEDLTVSEIAKRY